MADAPKKVEMPPGVLEHVANNWLLGADPEFAVVSPPNRTVKNQGLTAVEVNVGAGEIGWDHGQRVWELRPTPSRSAYEVVTNIWRLLKRPEMQRVENFKWKSGALGGTLTATQAQQGIVGWTPNPNDPAQPLPVMGAIELNFDDTPTGEDTLGGHVHFGISGLNAAQQKALRALTGTLLSLDILPRRENLKRMRLAQQRGMNYGDLVQDSVRSCNGHVEFRSAPSWLDRPGQALAALTAYKLAATRPSSVTWTEDFELKGRFLEWLADFGQLDVDAYLLDRLVDRQGFGSIQADPASDFKPRWRREDLWAK